MKKMNDRLYVSTVADDDVIVAEKYGIGIEIAEFCTASNMDRDSSTYGIKAVPKIESTSKLIFHAPFNELCPAAIDPMIVDITRRRYEQAFELSLGYGINKIVVHSGYIPLIYHKSWFAERSVEFWREFLSSQPKELEIYLENVMEDEPGLLRSIIEDVGDSRFKLCLDVGHANTLISDTPLTEWVDVCAPYLEHVHLHNNVGQMDLHSPVFDGSIDMYKVLTDIFEKAPDVTFTIESLHAGSSMEWLIRKVFFEYGQEI